MLKVIVYSVAGQPTFNVDASATAADIRLMVKQRFGYAGIYLPHTWVATDPD